ncbi:MAG: carboxypeptidase regulatory-like domain-containing protein, partial [Saprospiraceae bacterium]
MRKILLISCAFLLLGFNLNAQTKFSVKGTLQDTLNEPMAGATVVLLNASDSVLYKFGVSALSGTFTIKRVVAGDYILQATFVGYQTLNKNITVTENTNVGALTLQLSAQNLGELTVKADAIPLEVRSDTIAYNADAFKTQPGAVVEDLLKRLPGVEVEKDGSIKAQGEEVQKVVVDGKEFFGTDPQTATKNLPADAIDKVEVYDEMSDESDFTGVDDGQRTKTINLTLKKDKKKGYFGNFEAGYGTEDRFKARSNINRFNKKTQTSFIGMVNNNNEQGFSIRDYADFMGGFQNIGGGRRGRFNSNDLGVPINTGTGDGFITTGAGGLNLNHEFKKESTLNVSYFYTNISKDLERTIDREYIFGGNRANTFYEQADTQQSNFQNHNIRSIFRHKINDNNSLIWRGTFGYNTAGYDNIATNKNLTSENVLNNEAISNYNSDKNALKYNTSLTLRHKFEKKGRSMTATGAFNNQDSEQEAGLLSNLNFYNPDSTTNIDQSQVDNSQNLNYQVRATYTEPLGKRRYLSFKYNHRNYSRPLDKTFTDEVTGTIIDSLNV